MARDRRIDEHPLAKAMRGTWDFQLRSYESGQAYLSGGYLYKHRREHADDFSNRQQRAVPAGYARAVINTYKSLLGRASVTRTTGSEEFAQFLANCNGRGTSLQQHMLEAVFPCSQATGFTWVLVDMPAADPAQVLTKQDELDQGVRPYCVHYKATEVVNWLFDSVGNLWYIAVKEPAQIDPETGKVKRKEGVKLWTRNEWKLYVRNKEVDSGEHNLGVVPFVCVRNEVSIYEPDLGVSAIANIAPMNRTIYNVTSLLDEFLYRQCFNVLAIPADMLPEEGEINIGTSNALPINDGSIVPTYVTPPVAPAEFLLTTIEKTVSQIYQESGLVDKSAAQVAQAQSGIARAFEFHNTNTLLAKKADNLQEAEQAIAVLWSKWMDKDAQHVVQWPSNFDIRDATAELDELTKVLALKVQSPTLKRERVRRALSVLFDHLEPDIKKQIIDEIEQAQFGAAAGGAEGGSLFDQLAGAGA